MADRLAIYRGALRLLGASQIASLTEDHPSRYALDGAWRDVGNMLLAKGLWNFAIRTSELSNDGDVEPLFGFQYAYRKPEDWVRLASIASDQRFTEGLLNYEDEAAYWYADANPIFIRYVSNTDAYGWNVGAWRQPFADAFAAYLAFECGLPVSNDKSNRNDLFTLAKGRLKDAKTLDAVDERVQIKPPGRLARSRLANHNNGRRCR